MRSLSKILKRVIYESENPLQLKEAHSTIKKTNEKLLSKAELTRRRFYEDETKQLLEEALVKTRDIIEKSKRGCELISKPRQKNKRSRKKHLIKGIKAA